MSHEHLIKRTLYVSKCPKCGSSSERAENPPRERLCPCGTWVKYKEESFTGKDLK